MTTIPLANNRGVTLVDDEDAELVRQFRWCGTTGKKGRFTYTTYAYTFADGKKVSLHRMLVPDALRVDHRDGNGLNNQRSNLRACTHAENMRNTKPYRGKRYKGVTYRSRTMNWEAYITPPGCKQVHLGKFTSEEEAARAYDVAAGVLFGEFARLNLPDLGEDIGVPQLLQRLK